MLEPGRIGALAVVPVPGVTLGVEEVLLNRVGFVGVTFIERRIALGLAVISQHLRRLSLIDDLPCKPTSN